MPDTVHAPYAVDENAPRGAFPFFDAVFPPGFMEALDDSVPPAPDGGYNGAEWMDNGERGRIPPTLRGMTRRFSESMRHHIRACAEILAAHESRVAAWEAAGCPEDDPNGKE